MYFERDSNEKIKIVKKYVETKIEVENQAEICLE